MMAVNSGLNPCVYEKAVCAVEQSQFFRQNTNTKYMKRKKLIYFHPRQIPLKVSDSII